MFDIGDTGTVYIERHDKGAGIQNGFLKGSKGISGGGDKGEELIFTYNAPVLLDNIILALNDIEFGKLSLYSSSEHWISPWLKSVCRDEFLHPITGTLKTCIVTGCFC